MTFDEYQNLAAKVPVALRNDRDSVALPVLGLQEDAGKLGKLLSVAFASGKFRLTPAQSDEAKDRMADILWCLARLCGEAGISLDDFAAHSAAQIKTRASKLDPERHNNRRHAANSRSARTPGCTPNSSRL